MAVTYDTSAKNIQTSTVQAVCSMTIAADACLIVGVNCDTDVSVSACYANGTLLSQYATALNDASGLRVTMFVLTAAPSGVVSISANFVGGVAVEAGIMAGSYLGASTTSPFSPTVQGSASAVNTLTLSLSSTTTDRVVIFSGGVNQHTAIGATTRLSDNAHRPARFVDAAGGINTYTATYSAVITSQNLAYIGINVRMSIASVMVNFMSLCGVGF